MKRIYIYVCVVLSLLCSSCNDWLDVNPDTQVPGDEMFDTYAGFRDALTGCYITMTDKKAYGEQLTMSNTESLAYLWALSKGTIRKADYYLKEHDYKQTDAKDAIEDIYSTLYNTIVQANVIIKNVEEKGTAIADPAVRAVIQAEAYGIRAFCQLDILRMFGEVPGGTIKVSLPYSEVTGIDGTVEYYDFDNYVKKIEADLDKAESLLKDNDPLFKYSYDELNNVGSSDSKVTMDDTFMAYRQFRINYWAVKAMKARLYLYIGKKQQAYTIAMEIINAKGADGKPVMTLSGTSDIPNGYCACPSECLFALNNYKMLDYSIKLLGGNPSGGVEDDKNLLLASTARLNELFAGQNTASHNRYTSVWEKTKNITGGVRPSIKKYYYDKNNAAYKTNILTTKLRIIPLIRMSEIYLIAMEGTPNLNEANSLYKTYMQSHNVLINNDAFASLDVIGGEMISEYRREFFAEGQMFYTYKRNNSTKMLWKAGDMNEQEYIVPLPETEFNPNK